MSDQTPLDVEAIRARLDAIAPIPAPWEVCDHEGETNISADAGQYVAHIGKSTWPNTPLTAELIAHAPMDLRRLLDENARLQHENEHHRRYRYTAEQNAYYAARDARELRDELDALLPIASPHRTTKADRTRNWLHGAWESFAARAKTARAAANRWAREADRLEEWTAKRKAEKDAGTWPPCQGCDEHPALPAAPEMPRPPAEEAQTHKPTFSATQHRTAVRCECGWLDAASGGPGAKPLLERVHAEHVAGMAAEAAQERADGTDTSGTGSGRGTGVAEADESRSGGSNALCADEEAVRRMRPSVGDEDEERRDLLASLPGNPAGEAYAFEGRTPEGIPAPSRRAGSRAVLQRPDHP